jgi:hypothetical protein
MRADTTIRRNSQAVFRELADGSGVLLHLESTAYHGLNPVGVVIWQLLEHGVTFERLIHGLRGQFESPPPDLEKDVDGFLSQLAQRDLIRFETPASGAA